MFRNTFLIIFLWTGLLTASAGETIKILKVSPLGVSNHKNVKTGLENWTILLSEDFEDGIPDDWQVVDGNGDGYTWVAGTTGDLLGNDPPNYGTQYAYYSDNDAGNTSPQTPGEELITPSVNVDTYVRIKIKYAWGFVDLGCDMFKAEYSTDNGVTWNLIKVYSGNGNGWDSVIVFGIYSTIKVRFVYFETTSCWAYACAVDNVTIEGSESFSHDVGVTSVSPSGNGYPGFAGVFVTVANFGTNGEVNVPVYVEINDVPFNSPQYVNLPPGDSAVVVFGNYNFSEGSYTIVAYTALEGDEYTENDTMMVSYDASWWLQYDDGVIAGAACWYSANANNTGWGMRFDIPFTNVRIDSVFVGLMRHPDSVGEKPLVLVVYGDSNGFPKASEELWSKDTSLEPAPYPNWTGFVIYSDNFSVGSNSSIYYFWVNLHPCDGSYLCHDIQPSKPPEYYWQIGNYPNPSFGMGGAGDFDWFLRIHINGASGLNKWLPFNPHKEIFFSVKPSIVFGGKVNIILSTQEKMKVSVKILDVVGRIIKKLYEGTLKGSKIIVWDIKQTKAGIYFVEVSTSSYTKMSSKIIVINK